MSKSWKRAIVLLAIALCCWYVEIVVNPSNYEMLLGLTAVVFTVLCVCFLVIALIKQIKPDASSYKIFAWIDGILGIGATIYAIYDILTATGWFAGILGMLLLILVLPVIILLLIIDFVLYKRSKREK